MLIEMNINHIQTKPSKWLKYYGWKVDHKQFINITNFSFNELQIILYAALYI